MKKAKKDPIEDEIRIVSDDEIEIQLQDAESQESTEDAVLILENASTVGESNSHVADAMSKEIIINEPNTSIKLTINDENSEPRKANVQIMVREQALSEAKNHAKEDRLRETGGVLLGMILPPKDDVQRVVITGIVRALHAVRQTASVNFTPETWANIWRSIDQHSDYSDDQKWSMVGWYHTHPGFGIFLSSMDLSIHRGHFAHRGHVALVIDPKSENYGFFGWDQSGKDIVECSDIKILADKKLIEWLATNMKLSLAALPASLVELIVAEIPSQRADLEKSADTPEPHKPEASPDSKLKQESCIEGKNMPAEKGRFIDKRV